MRNLEECTRALEKKLEERQIGKYSFSVSESEGREFNLENGAFSLFRTVMGNSCSLTVFLDGRIGSVSGTEISDEGLDQIISDAVQAAESAMPDPMHDIAPFEEAERFEKGTRDLDTQKLFDRTVELKEQVEKEYPLINIMLLMAAESRSRKLYRNSNGTAFEIFRGGYGISLEFSASDGQRTTGIDFAGFLTSSLDRPFIDQAGIRQHLADTSSRLNLIPLGEKFTGTVVMTPDCAAQFMSMTLGNYVSSGVIMDGTSLWLDRVGTQVADESLTLSIRPWDSRIVQGECWTSEGFRSEDVTVIDRGILKCHLLSLYAANKTGRPVTKNSDSSLIVEPGSQSLAEIIKGIDRGIVMGDFSGGSPGTNGDFSGVAKNAFLIENGEIRGAISETMVSGNLGELLMHIRAISKETVEDGATVLPSIAVDGVVISGKL